MLTLKKLYETIMKFQRIAKTWEAKAEAGSIERARLEGEVKGYQEILDHLVYFMGDRDLK